MLARFMEADPGFRCNRKVRETRMADEKRTEDAGRHFYKSEIFKDGPRAGGNYSSSIGADQLPANYTFLPSENGVHVFTITLTLVGTRTITVQDTATASIIGMVSVQVTVAAASRFAVGGFLRQRGPVRNTQRPPAVRQSFCRASC